VNLLLFRRGEPEGGVLRLPPGDRRWLHVAEVLRLRAGDRLRAGRLNGPQGWAELREDPRPGHALELSLDPGLAAADPPAPAGPRRTLILALPRPPALRRLLELAPQLGLDRLLLVRSARVEKSYLQSPLLHRGEWRRHLELGLEQAMATRLPDLLVFPRFRPFVEDELERWVPGDAPRLLPHPGARARLAALPGMAGGAWSAAVGPEGGWVEAEVAALAARGFTPVDMGPRILRVEAAVQRLAAQLDLMAERQEGREP